MYVLLFSLWRPLPEVSFESGDRFDLILTRLWTSSKVTYCCFPGCSHLTRPFLSSVSSILGCFTQSPKRKYNPYKIRYTIFVLVELLVETKAKSEGSTEWRPKFLFGERFAFQLMRGCTARASHNFTIKGRSNFTDCQDSTTHRMRFRFMKSRIP